MEVAPLAPVDVEQLARAIHAEFRQKPESKHIASEFAMVELAKLIETIKPQAVLEIGAGIGTITKLLLQHPEGPKQLVVTENHPICLRELATNLHGLPLADYRLIHSAQDLDVSQSFDLVIFDGTLDDDRQYRLFNAGTWFFVEGGRGNTIAQLRRSLEARGLGLNIERRHPHVKKLKLLSKRKFLGLPLPAFRFKPVKGCSIGQVTG